MKKHTQQTLALAGIAQSAFLVHQLGRHGLVSQDNFAACINSLFVISPRSTEEVYGRVSKLNLGLQVLQEMFQPGNGVLKNPDIMRYIFGLLQLESRLRRKRRLMDSIGKGLGSIRGEHPEADKAASEAVIRQLGALYQNSVSTLSFRIQVRGDMQFLQNDLTAARIRAALLAGIRSAVLWRQLGGKRWHLLFYRKRISSDILALLSSTYGT